jgi:hypothetical protein
MTRFCLFALVLCFPFFASPAEEWITAGGKSAATGFTSATDGDFWSVHNNPAGMAFFNQPAAGIYYENRLLIRELGYQCGAFILPTKYGPIGGNLTYYGDQNLNRLQAGIAYARKFGDRVAAGLQFDFLRSFLAENYGSRKTITFAAGIQAKITHDLLFGAHVFNPVSAKISSYNDERIPSVINAGVTYTFSDRFNFTTEAVKSSFRPLDIRAGAEYRFMKSACARAGITTSPFRYTFGCGIMLGALTIDFSSSVHQVLGFSPQISMQYQFR